MNVNPQTVRKALLFVLGAALGGTVGYFVAGLIIYKLNETPEDCLAVEENDGSEPDEPRPALDGNEHIEPFITTDSFTKGAEEVAKNGAKKTDYARVAKELNPPGVDLAMLAAKYKTPAEQAAKEDVNLANKPMPYVISAETYAEDESFNKEQLTYYSQDATYANPNDEVVKNALQLVGNAHLHFGEMNDDPDMVYIRNEDLNIDYEVACIDKSYDILVRGLDPEPEPKAEKPKPEKKDAEDVVKKIKARRSRKVEKLNEEETGE